MEQKRTKEQIINALQSMVIGHIPSADCEEDAVKYCVSEIAKDTLALIDELTEKNTEIIKSWNKLKESHESACEKCRAEFKELINENAELKSQIQEADFTEEEIDFIDEYTRLLNEGIRDAKANNVSEIKTRFAMRFGTYTDKDMTPITEVFRLLDQIAKEISEN